MPEAFDSNTKFFLGHVIVILIAAIWAMLAPIYVASTSEGEIYSLTTSGWAGDPAASFALGTTNTGEYPTILWASVLAIAGGMVLLVTALVQKKAPAGLWGTLAALGWVPVVVPCLYLGADGFPMPTFSGTLTTINVTITAGWGGALWAQVFAASLAVGGTIMMSRAPAPKTPVPARQENFLDGPVFHKLQAELVIRQSYADPATKFPESETSNP